MTLTGDKRRFALQYELNDDYGGEWLFGRLCYWCDSTQVREFELGTSLCVVFELEQIGKYSGRRASSRFGSMTATDVFRVLNAALFGSEGISPGAEKAD